MNGWGSAGHTDIWDGSSLKGGMPASVGIAEEIWF